MGGRNAEQGAREGVGGLLCRAGEHEAWTRVGAGPITRLFLRETSGQFETSGRLPGTVCFTMRSLRSLLCSSQFTRKPVQLARFSGCYVLSLQQV